MKRLSNLLIILVGVVVAGAIVVTRTDDDAPPAEPTYGALAPLVDVERQSADERVYADVGLVPIETPAALHDSLLNVISARSFGGELYLSDYGPMQVRRVSADGRVIRSIGAGRGQGPGEVTSIMDVAVLNDTLWVADGPGRVLTAFSVDGDLIGRYPVSYFPMRLIGAGDRLYVVGMGAGDGLINEVDRQGNVVRSLDDLFEDQSASELSLSNSMLTSTPDGGFAYLPLIGSLLVLFDAEGTPVRTIETIDKRPVLGSSASGNGGQRAAGGDLQQRNVSIVDRTIYVHTGWRAEPAVAGTTGEPVSVIDRYAYPSGEYQDSFRIPATYDALVVGERLYAVSDTSFVAYRGASL